jgi:hypothetical protein
MTELSPQAQAVLDAYIDEDRAGRLAVAAATLRAAADQVVPEHPMVVPGGRSYEAAWSATVQDDIRASLLAIAAELETSTTEN